MAFDSSKLKVILVVALSLFAALYLGISAATAQFETIAWVVGAITLVTCILLGRRIWMLIPFMAALELTLRLPGLPNSLLLAQVLVLLFSTFLFLMRRLPYQIRVSELEILILLLVALVLQTYLRNPVGVSIFGTDTVGGKNYFLFAITCAAGFLLCFLRVPSDQVAMIFRLSVIGGLCNVAINLAGYFNPVIGFYTGASYSVESAASGPATDPGAAGRIGFLSTFSRNLALWISSVVSPVAAILHPFWALLIIVSGAMSALSGFRSAFMVVLLTLFLGIAYRGGKHQILIGSFAAIAALSLLASLNAIAPLPPNIQRALTFLPGTWDERYKEDAAYSTDWRVEIWKEVLTSDRWISNKILGDGLGFTAAELQAQMNAQDGRLSGVSGFDSQRENILASGDYHSTAVSAVRTCGYLGLVVLVIVMFRLCIHAHRLILRCRGTPLYSTSLFLGIPPMVALISLPISASNFLQVASASILSLSMMRLMENSLAMGEAATMVTASLPPQATSTNSATLSNRR